MSGRILVKPSGYVALSFPHHRLPSYAIRGALPITPPPKKPVSFDDEGSRVETKTDGEDCVDIYGIKSRRLE